MFSCEFCEISKNSLSYRTPLVAASAITVEEKYSPRILKDYFSLKIDPPIFTSTAAKLLHRSNETSWHFPALKRLNHFLPQSTTSHRSDLSSEVNSICWHKSVASSRLDLRVLSPAYRNSRPEVFLRKVVLKICCRFTGEHPCRSVISIKLQRNFVEIALRHGCSTVNLLQIFRTLFPKNTSGRVLLSIDRNITDNTKKVINLGKVCRIKNGGLRNSSINWIFLLRLLI